MLPTAATTIFAKIRRSNEREVLHKYVLSICECKYICILYVLEHVQRTRSARCPRSARSQEYLSVCYISMCTYMYLYVLELVLKRPFEDQVMKSDT